MSNHRHTRRRFLAQSAAAAGAAMLMPTVHVRGADGAPAGGGGSPPLLRWGIIGTGTRGNHTHIPGITESDDCKLVALCDVVEERLQTAAKRAGESVATYSDYQKLLANPDVNAVVIATPNLQHREQLQAALQAGKHVLCEKPAGVSFADAADMQRAAESAKTVVMFGMQYRHNARQRKIRELIDAGRIGKVKYLVQNCSRGDWNLSPDVWQYADPKLFNGEARNWRFSHAASGGTLNEFSCHYLDLLHWFAGGATPTSVSGDGGISVYNDGRNTWDHASLTMTYPDGVKAVHTLSLFGPTRADITVMGDNGSILLAGDTFQLRSAPAKKVGGKRRGAIEEDIEAGPASRKPRGAADPAVLELFADFVQCVKTGKKPDADAARALAASRACWLAELSAQRRAEVKWDESAVTAA